jgi:hypothetical protein
VLLTSLVLPQSEECMAGKQSSRIKIYEYAGCSTCKKALKFLESASSSIPRVWCIAKWAT